MGNKIGRNDKCPCGSGKKYKKCCIGKISNVKIPRPSNAHPLSKFNINFLIDVFSSSFLFPNNHGKNIRLELLMRESLLHGKKDTGSANIIELIKVLNTNYAHHHFEDPPVNPFTKIITFFGGDYLILPGISEGGDFILSNMLGAIFHTKNKLPNTFKSLVSQLSLLMLNISDIAIRDVGLQRYLEADIVNNEISVFKKEEAIDYINAISIVEEDFLKLCEIYKIEKEIINLILLDIQDEDLTTVEESKNPVIGKPLLKVDGGYKIISLGNFHIALLHAIIEMSISQNCLKELITIYTSIIWNNINVHLGYSDYIRLERYKPIDNSGLDIYEEFNRIDRDKIVYVSMQYDDGSNYDISNPFGSQGKNKNASKIEKHIDQVIKSLKTQFPDDKILLIQIFAGLGREYYRTYKKHADVEVLAFPAYYFDLIMNTREYEALDLWNYSQAKKRFVEKTRFSPFTDEIDLYSMYKDLDDSFYMNDDAQPDMMWVQLGYAKKFIQKVYEDEDSHSISREDDKGRVYKIPCVRIKGQENLYYSLADLGKRLTKAITGYKQPIWVESLDNLSKVPIESKGIYIEFLDAISYWIWQMTKHLSIALENIDYQPITINFDFKEKSKFHEIEFTFDREEGVEDDFEINVTGNLITIIIPHKILPYLFGEDNLGEQILVRKILEGFNMLSNSKIEKAILTPESINEIIENVVNIPHKKKIYLLNTNNNLLLDPRGTSAVRYIQEYNINKNLDELIPKLIKHKLITDKTVDIEDKNNFIKKMSSKIFLPELINEIEKYDSHFLLEHFIRLNESLIYKRNRKILNTPTMIACFISKEKQIEDLNESFQNIDRTTLSIRCLIEHIAACPGNGNLLPSQEDIDNLLAKMDQIINWGMIGDQVNYELYDIKIDVLKSGRIGTDKKLSEEVFKPFRLSKSSENVSDAINSYKNNYEDLSEDDGKEIFTKKTEEAFKYEYGVNLTQLIQFSQVLSGICFLKDPGCTIFYEDELISEIQKILPELVKEEILTLLNHFSLSKRKHIMDLPDGMETYDVFPWRFNRRLSLNQKPLVKVFDTEKKENKYYVGPRQLIKSGRFLLYLFYSGKLRTKPEGKLNKLIGKNLDKKGEAFTNEVHDYFNDNIQNSIIDIEVEINTKSQLKHSKDIGDIDVLVINKESKKIYLLECKNTEAAKNIKQLVEEVNNLFGSESKKGWIKKHKERYEWVIANKDLLGAKYNTDLNEFDVIPIMLTSEQLATEFLKKEELPFKLVSFYNVKEQLFNAFED
ncbi:SEC-C metal-binding domain-containing protein [uncultured Lacinutrix sp.]|uniref:YecA family protein n=1 Tax=uncultured Lacinutrix sp. TaxID=574032 RepID=UPI00262AE65C|nr:SEC-C metal-binding domain-containing protein [uncultured Lacinutrix sp.]